jgi:hypothetical protein
LLALADDIINTVLKGIMVSKKEPTMNVHVTVEHKGT